MVDIFFALNGDGRRSEAFGVAMVATSGVNVGGRLRYVNCLSTTAVRSDSTVAGRPSGEFAASRVDRSVTNVDHLLRYVNSMSAIASRMDLPRLVATPGPRGPAATTPASGSGPVQSSEARRSVRLPSRLVPAGSATRSPQCLSRWRSSAWWRMCFPSRRFRR